MWSAHRSSARERCGNQPSTAWGAARRRRRHYFRTGFENPEFQHFAHKGGSWEALRKRRAGWASRLELVRAGEVSEDGGRMEADEYGPAAALVRGISVQHFRASPYY